jgi:hypothetical protein
MRIFIIGGEGLCKKYGMIVINVDDILLIREIHDRYDFAEAILALHPEAVEESLYIKTFEQKYPNLAEELSKFINK